MSTFPADPFKDKSWVKPEWFEKTKPAPPPRLELPKPDLDPGATDGSFEEYLLERLFSHLHAADELLAESLRDGDGVSKALTAYAEVNKQLASARERWLIIRERQRKLVDIDEVMGAIGPELSEARRMLQGFGGRMAPQMDGTLEERRQVLDDEIDRFFRTMEGAKAAAEKVFVQPISDDDIDSLMEGLE